VTALYPALRAVHAVMQDTLASPTHSLAGEFPRKSLISTLPSDNIHTIVPTLTLDPDNILFIWPRLRSFLAVDVADHFERLSFYEAEIYEKFK